MSIADTHLAHREILWNVQSSANIVLMYSVFTLSVLVCAWGFWKRLELWSAGKPANERLGDWGTRLKILCTDVLGQRRVIRERHARVFHSLIVWGFMVLLFTTTMVFLDHDLGIDIYRGRFYLAVTILSDLFGLGLLIGVLHALYVRYLKQPDKLHSTLADSLMLVFLGLMVVQGFLLEGLRIQATNDPWAPFSPVGLAVGKIFWGLSPLALRVLHFLIWWFHSLTVFAFIALLPYTKFLHIFTSSANLYFREVKRPKGALPHPGDIEKLMEAAMEKDGDFSIGISTLADLSWKDRLSLDACTSCGRCQEVCPAYNSGKMLSPKWLILDTRAHMHALQVKKGLASDSPLDRLDAELLDAFTLKPQPYGESGAEFHRADNALVQGSVGAIGRALDQSLAGDVMDADVFWACTTCRACMEACPVGIEHIDYIVEARRGMALMQGTLPSEAQPALKAIETRGNPFGPAESRQDWSEGLSVRILAPGEKVDVLYWVGCISAFDKRKQQIARAMVQILNASGVDWGMLGNRECCTGDPARRLGEENIFQQSAKQNISTLHSVTFNRIVANCPHCFNSIKNEYPQVAAGMDDSTAGKAQFKIIHHTQFIKELLDANKLQLDCLLSEKITFHDPCYLGRHNDSYEEPRDVLVSIGSRPLVEMKDSKKMGMCCGAGGGHYWFDMKVGERINTLRVDQAVETGATTIATGCPFCLQMLEDGSKIRQVDDTIRVRDVAELVAEALL
jgi:Fe-S oxidoreductase/nitrate reductase gamma subunit